MSLYVLDTDILTLYQTGHAAVVANARKHFGSPLTVSVISVEEQLSGWYTRLRRAKKPDELAAVYQRLTDTAQSLARFRILSFTVAAIRRYEALRAKYPKLSKNDLRIAAIVLEAGGVLVTRNARDFRQVSGSRWRIGRSEGLAMPTADP
jgi:tRNA(fMet)-specific endonuclease VapC